MRYLRLTPPNTNSLKHEGLAGTPGYLRSVEHFQSTAFVITSSKHIKPYMILKALCKGFQEIYRFALLRSLGKEWQLGKVTVRAASPPTAAVAVAG